ncbi:Ribokinase-like protein, partial [Coccomyxa subellipsoidea C-169]
PPLWDVVGLGQAMVDISAAVDDDFVARAGLDKGSRRIISVEERAKLLEALDGSAYQVSAGGSLANTLVAASHLSRADHCNRGGGLPRIGMLSVSGDDLQGSFHCAQMQHAGIRLLSEPLPGTSTGTVIVLTTPDANRTFLSYLGSSQTLTLSAAAEAAICRTRVLIVEGYLWEMLGAKEAIGAAVRLARESGALVAMTTGDPGLVARHRGEFWRLLSGGDVDVLFANRAEASALLEHPVSAAEAASELGSLCSLAAITDGANGSCISALGRLQVVPPYWTTDTPVDTCGAGDAYCAGLLYAYLSGLDLASMGRCSARVASAVLSR